MVISGIPVNEHPGFRKKQMIGTGTPSLNALSAEVLIGAQGRDLQHAGTNSAKGESLTGRLEDIVDLSEDPRAESRRRQNISYTLTTDVPGRGAAEDFDPVLVDEQLNQVQEQLSLMRDLLPRAQNPDDRRVLARAVEEVVATMERAGTQISASQSQQNASITATASAAAKRFVSLVKGFREIVQEVETILADETRLPPPLMRLIKEMTSKSVNSEKQRIDALA